MEFSNSERVVRGLRASAPLTDNLSLIDVSDELNESISKLASEAASIWGVSTESLLRSMSSSFITAARGRQTCSYLLDTYLKLFELVASIEEHTEENKPIQSESLDTFLKEFERTSE